MIHGQRSLVGYSPWGHKRIRHDLATQWIKKCKKYEMRFARNLGRTKQPSWASQYPDCSLSLQPLFAHLNSSGSGADGCHVARTSGWQKSGNQGSFFCQKIVDFIHMCHSFQASAAALVCQASPWISQVQSFYCEPQF